MEGHSTNISKRLCTKTCNKTAVKKNTFVEPNAMNVSAKFQFILPVDSEELIFKYFFRNLAFWLP